MLATVLAIDEEINQITVQTDEGQRLMLLPPAPRAHLRRHAMPAQVTTGRRGKPHHRPEHEEDA